MLFKHFNRIELKKPLNVTTLTRKILTLHVHVTV